MKKFVGLVLIIGILFSSVYAFYDDTVEENDVELLETVSSNNMVLLEECYIVRQDIW